MRACEHISPSLTVSEAGARPLRQTSCPMRVVGGVASPDAAAPCAWWQPQLHSTLPRRQPAIASRVAAARRSRSSRCGRLVVALYKKDVTSWLGAKSDTSDTASQQRASPSLPPPQPRFGREVSRLLSNWFDLLPGITFSCTAADVDPHQARAPVSRQPFLSL